MTLRAWIITLRGRIREALVPELQELRDRHAYEFALHSLQLRQRLKEAEATGREWQAIADAAVKRAGALAPDARRGRFLLAQMQYQNCGQYSVWTLVCSPNSGDDPAAAVDAAMAKERGDDN